MHSSTRAPVFVAVFILIAAGTGTARTIHVPDDQPTIQAGIDSSVDGDTVLVADGVYEGDGNRDIDFGGGAIIVMSANGPLSCTVQCGGFGHRGFLFQSGEDTTSVVQGFTITGGDVWSEGGGGIRCSSSSPTIRGNVVRDNGCDEGGGGGIACYYCSPIIERNVIKDNGAYFGGGIHCHTASPTIRNNRILGNDAYHTGLGGGIACFFSSSPVITGNRISGNTAHHYDVDFGSGGGIYSDDSSITSVSGNLITGNSADQGGGMFCGFTATIESNTITGNTATYGSGDGILFDSGPSSSPTVKNTIVWDNDIAVASGEVAVGFSDVEGGWSGERNLEADPRFVDPLNSDYALSPRSHCIDSGDPASRVPENGGDRIDIGAFEFFQGFGGYLVFEGYPDTASAGSVVSWQASITNPTPVPRTIDGWVEFSGPMSRLVTKELGRPVPPGTWMETIDVSIPDAMEPGVYTVKGRVGVFGQEIWDSEVFDLVITEPAE